MKATLGGKDARCYENSGAYDPDLKIANNNFEIPVDSEDGFSYFVTIIEFKILQADLVA
jgi:hypothetical protein